MSEYWVSQAKHHCDFCKCWIADNKPSRDFHEKGKKHIENVKKKIDEIRKQGDKKEKKEAEMKNDMEAMERAAMKALEEDLKANPSLASMYGVKPTPPPEEGPQLPPGGIPIPDIPLPASSNEPPETEESARDESSSSSEGEEEECPWSEAKSPEGYTYYWHKTTHEVTWVKPDDYREPGEPKKKVKRPHPNENSNIPLKKQKVATTHPIAASSSVQPQKTHNSDASKAKSSTSASSFDPSNTANMGPAPRPCAYGTSGWETIEKVEEEPLPDLQLPSQKKQQEDVKVITLTQSKMKFVEKKAPALGSELVAFKKRNKKKPNFNFRQKADD